MTAPFEIPGLARNDGKQLGIAFLNLNCIFKNKLLSGLQAMIQLALGDIAGEAYGVGDAVPGLDADEGAAGLLGGPETVGLGAGAVNGEDLVQVLVQQGYADNLTVFYQNSVIRKGIFLDGDEGVQSLGFCVRVSEAAVYGVLNHRIHRIAFFVHTQEVAVALVLRVVFRQVEGRVGTNLEVQVFCAWVHYRPAADEAVTVRDVFCVQFKVKGIIGVVGVNHLVAVLPYFLKLGIPGEAMLAHFVLHAVYAERSTGNLAHYWEQDGGTTAPEGRVSLPEVFVAVLLEALGLCAVVIDFECYHCFNLS